MRLYIKNLVISVSLIYLCLVGIGLTYSDILIFLPQTPSYTWSDDLIRIKTKSASEQDSEHIIVGRYLKNPDSRYTILYSHGNAVDLGGLNHLQQNFYSHGYSIFIYDYSGYGHSEGKASEQQVYNDVQAVYSYLIEQQNVEPRQIISYGHSLGSGVATDLAFTYPLAALILESPFTTAFRVKTIYPLVPFDKFTSIDKIDKVHTPVFITHSVDDTVIPFWHGEELFAKASEPKKSLWLENEGHSGITHNLLFWNAFNSFVNTVINYTDN